MFLSKSYCASRIFILQHEPGMQNLKICVVYDVTVFILNIFMVWGAV